MAERGLLLAVRGPRQRAGCPVLGGHWYDAEAKQLSDMQCYYAAAVPPVPLVNTSANAMYSVFFTHALQQKLVTWESGLVRQSWYMDICTVISDSADSNQKLIHWLIRADPANTFCGL